MAKTLPPPVYGVRVAGPECDHDPNTGMATPCFCHDETIRRRAGNACSSCGCRWVAEQDGSKYIIAVGHLGDGFKFYGPFDGHEATHEHALTFGLATHWQIFKLEEPK